MKTNHALTSIIAVVVICTGYATPTFASTTTGTVPSATVTSTKPVVVFADQVAIEKKVREFFKATPTMIEIARCESKFRQYTDSGNPLRSNGMIGVFQFYESIHAPGAKALGLDLATLDGNLGYAKHVYEAQGTTPWNGSSFCWETASYPTVAASTVTVSSDAHRAKLLEQIATLTKLITLLQKQLNAQKLHSK